MEPDDESSEWSGSGSLSAFLSVSRDRISESSLSSTSRDHRTESRDPFSSTLAVNGSGNESLVDIVVTVDVASASMPDVASAPPRVATTPSSTTASVGHAPPSRRVVNLRHQFGRSKAMTLSDTTVNNASDAMTCDVATGADATSDATTSADALPAPRRAASMRAQFRRRKAITIDDPDHQYLSRRASEKVRCPPKSTTFQRRCGLCHFIAARNIRM